MSGASFRPSVLTSGAPAPTKVALGYYAGDDPIVYSSVTSFTSYITAVSAARFEISTAGDVTGTLPNTGLIPFDTAHNIHTYAGVYDSAGNGFDGKLAHTAMVTHKGVMIANLVKLAKAGGFRLDDPQGAVGIEFMVVNDVPGPHPTAPPRGAAGHVASRWQMPDGNYVRGLFAVLYKPLVATAV